MYRDQFQQQKKFFDNILDKISKDIAFLREAGFDCETNEKVTAKFNAFIADKTATKERRKDNTLKKSKLKTSDGSELTIKRIFSGDGSISQSSVLGIGTFGAVKLCTYNGKNAVIKICDDSDHDPLHQFIAYCYTTNQPELLQNYDTFVREVGRSSKLRTAQKGDKTDLIKGRKRTGYECTYENKYFKRYVVLPDLGDSLSSLLQTTEIQPKQKLDETNKIKVFLNTVARVYALHSKGIIHGDIKPGNILIKKNKAGSFEITDHKQVQLGDFDSVRKDGDHEEITTYYYTAPGYQKHTLMEADIVALFRTFHLHKEPLHGIVALFRTFHLHKEPLHGKEKVLTGHGAKDNIERSYHLFSDIESFPEEVQKLIIQGASPYSCSNYETPGNLLDQLVKLLLNSCSNYETPSNLLDQLVKLLLEYLKKNKNLEGVDLESLGYRNEDVCLEKINAENNTSNPQKVISTQPTNTTPTPESTSTHGHKSTSTQDHNEDNDCCQRIHNFLKMFFEQPKTYNEGVGVTDYRKKLN